MIIKQLTNNYRSNTAIVYKEYVENQAINFAQQSSNLRAEAFSRRQILHFGGSFEFVEEAEVVFEVVAEVVDLPFEHGDALNAHAECESAVLFGIYARGFEHIGVDHAASHDFQPACSLADVAAFAVTDVAADINFRRRLGEGEIGWTHADPGVRAEHLAGEKQDGLLQVGEGHAFVYVETLHLMEDAVCTG